MVLEVLSQADKMKLAWTIFYDSDLVRMFENLSFIQYLSEMMENGTTENGNKPKMLENSMLHSNFCAESRAGIFMRCPCDHTDLLGRKIPELTRGLMTNP